MVVVTGNTARLGGTACSWSRAQPPHPADIIWQQHANAPNISDPAVRSTFPSRVFLAGGSCEIFATATSGYARGKAVAGLHRGPYHNKNPIGVIFRALTTNDDTITAELGFFRPDAPGNMTSAASLHVGHAISDSRYAGWLVTLSCLSRTKPCSSSLTKQGRKPNLVRESSSKLPLGLKRQSTYIGRYLVSGQELGRPQKQDPQHSW